MKQLLLGILAINTIFLQGCAKEAEGICIKANGLPVGRIMQEEAQLAVGNDTILEIPRITFFEAADPFITLCRSKAAKVTAALAVNDKNSDVEKINYEIMALPSCSQATKVFTSDVGETFIYDSRSTSDRNSGIQIAGNQKNSVTLTIDTLNLAPSGTDAVSYLLELWATDKDGNMSDAIEYDVRINNCTE